MVYLHCPTLIPMLIQRPIPMELGVIAFLRRVYSVPLPIHIPIPIPMQMGYCTQFDTDIGTNKVFLSNFLSNFALESPSESVPV